MMNCGEVAKVASFYLDGEFEATERVEVQKHLEQCSECRARMSSEHQFRQTLREKLQPVPAPNYLRQRIVAEIDDMGAQDQSRDRWSVWAGWLRPASVFLAMTVVVGLVWLSVEQSSPTAPVDPGSTNTDTVANTVSSSSTPGVRPELFDRSATVSAMYSGAKPFESSAKTAAFSTLSSYRTLPADVRGDGKRIRGYMQQRMPFQVKLPLAEGPRVQLTGARQVRVRGEPAVLFIYGVDGERVSILQQSARDNRPRPLRLQRKGTITLGEFGRDGVFNTVVSELDSATLGALLTHGTDRR